MSIGEPQHRRPPFVLEALRANLHRARQLSGHGRPAGTARGLRALAGAAFRPRGAERVDPETMVLPVNGTREALFAFAQAVVIEATHATPVVVMPNPFYQIYEGAALLAGAEPVFMNTTAGNRLPAGPRRGARVRVWRRCQLLYLCSPGNPTGAVMDLGLPAARARAGGPPRLRDRRRRVLQRAVFRRGKPATGPAQRLRRTGPQ